MSHEYHGISSHRKLHSFQQFVQAKFKFKFKKFLFKKYKKIYKYRMETETLEGLYVPSSIFNSLHNNILFCDNTD